MAENSEVFQLVGSVFPNKETILHENDGITVVFHRDKGYRQDAMNGDASMFSSVVFADKNGTHNHTKISDLLEVLDKSESLVFDFKGNSKLATVFLKFGGVKP